MRYINLFLTLTFDIYLFTYTITQKKTNVTLAKLDSI